MTRPTDTGTRLVLHPLAEADPRLMLDERALTLASRNGFPVVAQRPSRRDGFGLAVGGGVAVLLGGLTFWSMSAHRTPLPPATPSPARVAPLSAPPLPMAAPSIARPTPSGLLLPSVPTSIPALPQARPAPDPVLVFDGGAATLPASPPIQAAATTASSAARPGVTGGSDNDQFAARIGDGDVPVASAQQLSDPATTVTQGTLIPAVLETAIDTDLPGYVRALVSQDVRSFDGAHVLIPRSSRLIGQYKSGLAAGQTRAYVIWTRLIRPDGASVALGSPGVDFSGTTGLAGKVDGHFMKRFGSAALLTVIGGLGAIGGSGTSVVLSGGGQSAASVAAQRDTAIPPTIHVAQGQPIRIFTAKDLDFSSVPAVVASR